MKLANGLKTNIHSYKHNEQIHRVWKGTKIIDINENYIVTAHEKSRVYEQTGRSWVTKEPAVCYFYDDLWFNVIVMFKKTGIFYYCNIASPYIYDGEAIKYIDYDLDVKVFPDGTFRVLDRNEYKYHSRKMNYSNDIKIIIDNQLEKLIKMVEDKKEPFNKDFVMRHYNIAFDKKEEKNE